MGAAESAEPRRPHRDAHIDITAHHDTGVSKAPPGSSTGEQQRSAPRGDRSSASEPSPFVTKDVQGSSYASDGHDAAYDIPVAEKEEVNVPWLFDGKAKSQDEVRDESYCSYIRSMQMVFVDRRRGVLDKQQALRNVEYYLAKVQELGKVDADRVRDMLTKFGIDDTRRLDMQHEYQELRKDCGQRVPVFGEKGMKKSRDTMCC
mmetsp:Transcript_29195/g.82884  ORF Transcript_29195/g.82884 Transcript_29195/m.82884 type:complete len:204 (-) Transcript_29195:137-748(-)